MKRMKKVFLIIVCLSIFITGVYNSTLADNVANLQYGDYIQLGSYNGNPIIWRYVADDEYGKLLVSDKVLSFKLYGEPSCSKWEGSYLRPWLNSADTILWEYKGEQYKPYGDELGFLSNFTQEQLVLMKSTPIWTMTSSSKLAENGVKTIFTMIKEYGKPLSPPDFSDPVYYTIEEVPDIYYGAAKLLEDKVFIPDEMQLYNMWKNLGTITTTSVNSVVPQPYCTKNHVRVWIDGTFNLLDVYREQGIRPAFYLNEDAVASMTGSGTETDPYIFNVNREAVAEPISVLYDGAPVEFDQEPIIENDRTLVPMRAIFEAMGAEVEWVGETRTVTASYQDTTISMQIDNPVMTVNGREVELDVPPRIVGDRTLVPVRAVSESFNAKVEWIAEDRCVVITSA